MKKIIIGSLFLIASSQIMAAFTTITTYQALTTSLEAGDWVRGVVFFRNCTLSATAVTHADTLNDFTSRLQTLGFNFSIFSRYFANEAQTTVDQVEVSKRFFSVLEEPSLGNVSHYIRFNFFNVNQVTILYRLLDPLDNSLIYNLEFVGRYGKDPLRDCVILYRILGSVTLPTTVNTSGTTLLNTTF